MNKIFLFGISILVLIIIILIIFMKGSPLIVWYKQCDIETNKPINTDNQKTSSSLRFSSKKEKLIVIPFIFAIERYIWPYSSSFNVNWDFEWVNLEKIVILKDNEISQDLWINKKMNMSFYNDWKDKIFSSGPLKFDLKLEELSWNKANVTFTVGNNKWETSKFIQSFDLTTKCTSMVLNDFLMRMYQ